MSFKIFGAISLIGLGVASATAGQLDGASDRSTAVAIASAGHPQMPPLMRQKREERTTSDDSALGVELFDLPATPAPGVEGGTGDAQGRIDREPADAFLVTRLVGTHVYAPDDTILGDVDDVLATLDGDIQGVVIAFGGFLGLGEKRIAIRFSELEIVKTSVGPRLVLDMSVEELERAPQFMSASIQAMEAERARRDALAQAPATR